MREGRSHTLTSGTAATMHIAIVGGTGFLGRHIAPALAAGGHVVTIVTRNRQVAIGRVGSDVRVHEWAPSKSETLEQAFRGQDAVINLAGASIANGRWTLARKDRLRVSRIETTGMIVHAMSRLSANLRPTIFISASGIGFYGLEATGRVDETTKQGHGFLADLCGEWEQAARGAADSGIRTVWVRISMVLAQDGGALQKMRLPFRLFLGGPIGPGTQSVSWIHVEDLGRLIKTILADDAVNGPVNAASPHPVTMKDFCRQLGKTLRRPSWLPVPAWVLQIGLGEMATLMTHGQWVHPSVATALGFTYHYPSLESALAASTGKGQRKLFA